jgi:hypothetical protein
LQAASADRCRHRHRRHRTLREEAARLQEEVPEIRAEESRDESSASLADSDTWKNFPSGSTPAPGALSRKTHDAHQRSESLSEKLFGQEVHSSGDSSPCSFF